MRRFYWPAALGSFGSGDAAVLSKYDYTNDALGRPASRDLSGHAFGLPSPAIAETFAYNARNEVVGSTRSDRVDLDRSYGYDPIGNRISSAWDYPPSVATYTSNAVNQYQLVNAAATNRAQAADYDEDGNLTELFYAGDLNGDGQIESADLNVLLGAMNTCDGDAGFVPRADLNFDGCVDSSDMNLLLTFWGVTNDGTPWASLVWDCENRLVGYTPLGPAEGDQRFEYAYDHQSRRIAEKIYTYTSGAWSALPTRERRFVWAGWLTLLETDGNDDVTRKYTWGLDLAGLSSGSGLDGAGGIGGLLAVEQAQVGGGAGVGGLDAGSYVFTYDANGNVAQVIDYAAATLSASIVAHYEYDPFGNVVNDLSAYAYAEDNPWRFSTKQFNDATGLGYWGYRYYSPTLGRWINRDPIEERGGVTLYGYVGNRALARIDGIGLNPAGLVRDAWLGATRLSRAMWDHWSGLGRDWVVDEWASDVEKTPGFNSLQANIESMLRRNVRDFCSSGVQSSHVRFDLDTGASAYNKISLAPLGRFIIWSSTRCTNTRPTACTVLSSCDVRFRVDDTFDFHSWWSQGGNAIMNKIINVLPRTAMLLFVDSDYALQEMGSSADFDIIIRWRRNIVHVADCCGDVRNEELVWQ